MKISNKYAATIKKIEANIVDNMRTFGGVQGQVISRNDADNCPDNVTGRFVVLGENGYREEDTHLAAAIVRICSVHNARNIWHVREDGIRHFVLSS